MGQYPGLVMGSTFGSDGSGSPPRPYNVNEVVNNAGLT